MERLSFRVATLAVFSIPVFAGGCSPPTTSPGLQPTIDVLLMKISAQSTRIADQEARISYLATNMPPAISTPMTHSPPAPVVLGSILIEDGRCCVGATTGQTIAIRVTFQASSPTGDVSYMRLRTGPTLFDQPPFTDDDWRAFVPSEVFEYVVPGNWTGFYVIVQFKDTFGNLSAVYSSDISVEGMPLLPTASTP